MQQVSPAAAWVLKNTNTRGVQLSEIFGPGRDSIKQKPFQQTLQDVKQSSLRTLILLLFRPLIRGGQAIIFARGKSSCFLGPNTNVFGVFGGLNDLKFFRPPLRIPDNKSLSS